MGLKKKSSSKMQVIAIMGFLEMAAVLSVKISQLSCQFPSFLEMKHPRREDSIINCRLLFTIKLFFYRMANSIEDSL